MGKLTLIMRLCAFPTSMSMASLSSCVPWWPSEEPFTVVNIFSWPLIVGILSHTWRRFCHCKVLLVSEHNIRLLRCFASFVRC